jgi:hypothetical protein
MPTTETEITQSKIPVTKSAGLMSRLSYSYAPLVTLQTVVVRRNFSRDPKRGGSGDRGEYDYRLSKQKDPKRASPVRAERAYIKDWPKVDPNYAARL